MSKIIGLIIVIFLLLTEFTLGQSVAMPNNAFDDLRSTNLNRENLSVYEEQAVLKLQDVLDYGMIIGSQKYNLELRETALEATLSSFDKAAKLPCTWLLEPKTKTVKNKNASCTAAQLFQALLEMPSYELEILRENIRIEEKLRKISKNTYQGELIYEQQVKTKKNKTTSTFKEGKKEVIRIQFLLKRIDKQFGSTKEVVWEVKFLGML
jgi:hypothetical protein